MNYKKQLYKTMETTNSQLIRVAVVDDHKIFAGSLVRLICELDMTDVIWEAYSTAECWKMLENSQPDVLMLDISLPDGNGIDLCLQIKKKYPQVKIIMLTSYSELSTIKRALDAGADGYVLKNSMPDELLEGIRTVVSGKNFLCDGVDIAFKKQDNDIIELTRRELELLKLIIEGNTLQELALKMRLGQQTIRSYRKNLNIKLGAHNTAQLIKNAQTLNLL